MNAKHALIYSIIISILLVGGLFGFYYQQQTQLITSINTQLGALSQEVGETRETLQAQLSVESASLRDELNQRSDFLLSKILETEAKSSEEIEKITQETQQLGQKLKDVQISSQDFTAIIEDVVPSVIFIRTDVGSGSGVIVDPDGLAITNYHVMEGAKYGQAHDYKGRVYPISLLGYNQGVDLAVITLSGEDRFDPLSFGDSDTVSVGQKVIAVGNPGGYSFSVTEGIISAFQEINNIEYLQHDVAINPGNSGGPLINSNGDIIGINTMKAVGFEGVGFAIQADRAKRTYQMILSNAIEQGKYEPE